MLPLSEQNLLRRKDGRARHRRHRSSRPHHAAAAAAAAASASPLAADPPTAASPLTSDNTGASPRLEPSSDSAISRAAPRASPRSRGGGEGGTGATGHRPQRADSDPTAASGMVEVASSLSRKRSRFKRRELRSGSARNGGTSTSGPGDARGVGEGGGAGGSGTGAASHHSRRADADSNATDGMVELASSLARKENPMAGKVRRPRPKRLALSSLHTCLIGLTPNPFHAATTHRSYVHPTAIDGIVPHAVRRLLICVLTLFAIPVLCPHPRLRPAHALPPKLAGQDPRHVFRDRRCDPPDD